MKTHTEIRPWSWKTTPKAAFDILPHFQNIQWGRSREKIDQSQRRNLRRVLFSIFSNFASDFIDEKSVFFLLIVEQNAIETPWKPPKNTIRSHRKNWIICLPFYAPTKYPSRETVPLIHHWAFPCMMFFNYVRERDSFTLCCIYAEIFCLLLLCCTSDV